MKRLASSFRDPAGYLFEKDGCLFRHVDPLWFEQYRHLVTSGLYEELTRDGLLVSHEEVEADDSHIVIKPTLVPVVSYPYEWCLGQLQEAAAATLEIVRRAHRFGMTLKDASAYNVQFVGTRPVFIDTLSFDFYKPGSVWKAYGQFCRHFLGPLLLMGHADLRLVALLRDFIDGLPIEIADRMLPLGPKLRPSVFMHVKMHARAERGAATMDSRKRDVSISEYGYLGLIDSLSSAIGKIRAPGAKTVWTEYYRDSVSYEQKAHVAKISLVERLVGELEKGVVALDLGANTGMFSRLIADRYDSVLAVDGDPAAVEECFRLTMEAKCPNVLPLYIDLTNPSPALGWNNAERSAFLGRTEVDLVMALALVHHLAIANNLPLPEIVNFLAAAGRNLLVEFVPADDPMSAKMIADRGMIHPGYTLENFEKLLGRRYTSIERHEVPDSCRTMLLCRGANS